MVPSYTAAFWVRCPNRRVNVESWTDFPPRPGVGSWSYSCKSILTDRTPALSRSLIPVCTCTTGTFGRRIFMRSTRPLLGLPVRLTFGLSGASKRKDGVLRTFTLLVALEHTQSYRSCGLEFVLPGLQLWVWHPMTASSRASTSKR